MQGTGRPTFQGQFLLEETTMPPIDVILSLQELLLRAVLMGHLMPGQNEPVRLPDISFFQREPVVYLAKENLAGPVSLTDLEKPLRTLTVDEVKSLAHQQGNIPYLQFLEPEVTDDEVRLTLVAMIASQDPKNQALGLSGVHVIFVNVGAGWEIKEDPVYSAF
jgi:hypothetical protein